MFSDGGSWSKLSARLLVVRVDLGGRSTGKSVDGTPTSDKWILRVKRLGGADHREMPSKLMCILPVPQTDTGRQVENTKVFERTLVKELGKLTP